MEGITPSDFVAWVTPEKGRRIVAFAEKLGVPMTYDDELEYIKSTYLTIKRPMKNGGALRSPQKNFKDFWRAWRVENPGERQFRARPMATEFPDEECVVGEQND